MRRPRLLLLLLLITIAAATFIVIILKRQRPTPTRFNWQAYVTSVAGNGAPGFHDLVQPTQAGFSDPFGIAMGNDGAIYVSDSGESNRIRKLSADGKLITIAGGNEGFADGSGAQASFNTPSGLAIDHSGNIYVADTGNNRIRKVTPQGVVTTVAGTGTAGYLDGAAESAQFDGPIGVAVDAAGNIYVADTYNDRIRKITADAQVSTVAGAGRAGLADGDTKAALFDTPCGVVVYPDGTLVIADTGNNRLRKIDPAGQVTTLAFNFDGETNAGVLRKPVGLALTHDDFLYVTESDRGRVVQIAPDGKGCVIAGNGPGFADGSTARFNQPSGLAIDPRNGDLVVADSANYLVRKLSSRQGPATASNEMLPRLTADTLAEKNLMWPLDPQNQPHEVVATVGEVRGTYESTDSRDHLHSGLDVFGAYGDVVRTIRSEKVTNPLPNWGFDSLSEGLRIGVVSYIHMHVGRDKDAKVFNDPRFVQVNGDDGKLARMRVRRGTRFRPGDALGTVNKMYHVHLIVGPSGAEINPLALSPIGFKDTIAPTIEKDGVQLFDESGTRLTEKDRGRLIVHGRARIVVDAFDRTDMNSDRRRLGLYSLGYQVLNDTGGSGPLTASGSKSAHSHALKEEATNRAPVPAPGFTDPRITILFNRLPYGDDAPKLAYVADSGITVYGSKTTRFLYEITNTVRDGRASPGIWDTGELPKGDYLLRIIAADFSGNATRHDVPIAIR